MWHLASLVGRFGHIGGWKHSQRDGLGRLEGRSLKVKHLLLCAHMHICASPSMCVLVCFARWCPASKQTSILCVVSNQIM